MRSTNRKPRALLSEFSSRLGNETLNVRIYTERGAYVCERELVERDGTSFTMVLPFRKVESIRAMLAADPHYAQMRLAAARALVQVERAARVLHGKGPR